MYNKQKLIALSLLTAMFTACSSDEPKIGIEENEANSYNEDAGTDFKEPLLPQIPDLEPVSRYTYNGVYGYVYK
ncbi:MAG: hypothetical protein HDS55_07240 [Barnesiella sp.]|nr:hypothetical protein [Barnesiella sp.]